MAPTGNAAAAFEEGRTIHAMCKLPYKLPKDVESLEDLMALPLAALKRRLAGTLKKTSALCSIIYRFFNKSSKNMRFKNICST